MATASDNGAARTLAAARLLPSRATLRRADLYDLAPCNPPCDAGLAAFWWSHVARAELRDFLDHSHRLLAPGALVMLLDNRCVEGSSTPVARTDSAGDTWKLRRLDDGTAHEVLKNFPTQRELHALLSPLTARPDIVFLDYYWYAAYRLPDGVRIGRSKSMSTRDPRR